MSTENNTNNTGNNSSSVIGIIALIVVIMIAFASCGGGCDSDRGYDVTDDPDYDKVYNYYKYGEWD